MNKIKGLVIASIIVLAGYFVFNYISSTYSYDGGYVYETQAESEDDCTSYEKYDNENGICYFECNDEEDCARMERLIDEELDSYLDEFEEPGERHEDSRVSDFLAVYRVLPNENVEITSGDDTPEYRKIWEIVKNISPDYISDNHIYSFNVYRDENSDVLAYVEPFDDTGKWVYSINLGTYEKEDEREKLVTIVHELAHIVSLNKEELNQNTTCNTLKLDEGCSNADSHINIFWNKFWQNQKDGEYKKDDFVSEYASSNVVEDFAESFAYFVLDSKKAGERVRDQKVLSFYDSETLSKMREEMRAGLKKEIIRARRIEAN